MTKQLEKIANMILYLLENSRIPDNSDYLEKMIFICDRENFLKNGELMSGGLGEKTDDIQYMALNSGPRILYRGFPLKAMLDYEELFKNENNLLIPVSKFSGGNFTELEISILRQVSQIGYKIEDPFEWNRKTLDYSGEGSIIDFRAIERTMFTQEQLVKRNRLYKTHKAAISAVATLEDLMEKEDSDFNWMDNYGIVDLNDPVSRFVLNNIFSNCRFKIVVNSPISCKDSKLFSCSDTDSNVNDIKKIPASWIAVKSEDYYPDILSINDFAGRKNRNEAIELIKKDYESKERFWIIAILSPILAKPFCAPFTFPKIFRNKSDAFRFLCDECQFDYDARELTLHIDLIETVYCVESTGRKNWRIISVEVE